MGLAINYNLSAPNILPIRTLRGWLEQTRAFALELGCKEVDPVRKARPKYGWGRRLLDDPTKTGIESLIGDVDPRRGYIVEIWPGDGCESARFGLCQYPRLVRLYGHLYRPYFARGWSFSGSCKTQYAHEHGWEHFLWCHQTILRLLAFLRDLGMGVAVSDEGEYWETRSEEKLRHNLGLYDGLMAALGGMCKDAAAEDGHGISVESPIFDNAHFERLEHEGRQELGRTIGQLRKEIRKEIL